MRASSWSGKLETVGRTIASILSSESPSLWNCTLSPGWGAEDIQTLRMAIAKFGLGHWTSIIQQGSLPEKTPAQLSIQTQRLLGQQSLGDFMDINLDTDHVLLDNLRKTGDGIIRKSGSIINTGNNPTPKERQKNIQDNKAKYGLPQHVIDAIVLPTVSNLPLHDDALIQSKRERLEFLKKRLKELEEAQALRKRDLETNTRKVGEGKEKEKDDKEGKELEKQELDEIEEKEAKVGKKQRKRKRE